MEGFKGLSIYSYDEVIKSKIYQLKGCNDYVLASSFLETYGWMLHLFYLGYILVPMPSSASADEKRGFNHVVEIFKSLKLPIESIFYKNQEYKQSDQNKEGREKIKDVLCLRENVDLKNKKILLVDDILTTGNTLKTAINLIRDKGTKNIKILVYSSGHIFNENYQKNHPSLSLIAKSYFQNTISSVRDRTKKHRLTKG